MHSLPTLGLFSIPLLLGQTLASQVHAQSEATFPISPSADEDEPSEEAPTAEQPSAPTTPEGTEPETHTPPEPVPAPSPERDPNPYGPPPAPPPPVPGNPYGTVPHRPPTPATNPYVGGPQSVPTSATPEPPEPMEKTNWSVGGGFVTETLPNGYQSYSPGNQSRIVPSLFFERRLSDSLHLLFQSSVFYQRTKNEYSEPARDDGTLRELGFRFDGGLRWIANPGGSVELGMSHVLTFRNNQTISESYPNVFAPGFGEADLEGWSLGLSNSFLAERRLIPHLWLRMAVGLVGVHYQVQKLTEYIESEDEETGETVESEEHSTSRSLLFGLTPSLGLKLRLTF